MNHRRAGTAIVMALVALTIASLVIASQATAIIARQRGMRQARAKAQARWFAESALDRARLSKTQLDGPGQEWRPDVAPSGLPSQAASLHRKTDQDSVELVVVARVGAVDSPDAAQHTLRESLPKETEP
jgi:hypothetical protein